MSLKFERKLPVILFFVFLMLTTIGFVFYQNTISLQQIILWEKEAQDVVSRLDETLASSQDIENGTSGFIVSGSETYLERFNRAKPKITQNIGKLRQLMADKPDEVAELAGLEALLNDFVAEAERKVALRKSDGYLAAVSEIATSKSRLQMDGIRASIDRLKSEEMRALRTRELELDTSLYRTIWILIVSSVVGIASLGLANLVVLYEIKRRRSAEQELIGVNQSLEERIDERTRELQKANERLSEIGTERELLLVNEQKARKEAEIANRLRDEFMATVSHELRTPLNSILGWARLMKGGTLDPDQSTKAVTTIIKNSETQNRLIEDLLDVARIISGKLEIVAVPVDAAEIVKYSVESVRPAAEAKHISIDVGIDDNAINATVEGDKNRLMQVFSNLLTNAIKFGRERGKIDVAVSANNNHVEIQITDDGIGISRDFLPLVFERFRQDTSASAKNGGLGLGLAIARNLVEMHGGSVNVHSEGENKGSVFTVVLPVTKSGS